MSLQKSGRIAVVTGAAAGLGRAYAVRLAHDGATVVVADVADGSATLDLVRDAGGNGVALHCDVSDPKSVSDLARDVTGEFGRVDILVNNAGIYPMAGFRETTLELWNKVIGVNLTGTFLMCKAFIDGMAQRSYGRIVNIASRTYWINSTGYTHYIASKGGVIGLSRALATEYGAHGITVNVVAPGLVRTEHNEQVVEPERYAALLSRQAIPRLEEPGDLVGAISFLTSDDAAFITGQTLLVEGGMVRL
jgi:3-oxoacyl-[acyl-carrier protein] reductase/(S)-1-phenylethanol dehydrogenase